VGGSAVEVLAGLGLKVYGGVLLCSRVAVAAGCGSVGVAGTDLAETATPAGCAVPQAPMSRVPPARRASTVTRVLIHAPSPRPGPSPFHPLRPPTCPFWLICPLLCAWPDLGQERTICMTSDTVAKPHRTSPGVDSVLGPANEKRFRPDTFLPYRAGPHRPDHALHCPVLAKECRPFTNLLLGQNNPVGLSLLEDEYAVG
jgi:hypothetical protein